MSDLFSKFDELADRLDFRLLVHGDEDVELILDGGDEIEHGEAVPLQVLGEAGGVADLDPLLVERLDQGLHPGVSLGSVSHGGPSKARPILSQRNGARMRRFKANPGHGTIAR